MNTIHQIARSLREVYFGGNWTSVNYKDILQDVDWKQATSCLPGCNSIATLVYHTGYYIAAVTEVLQGRELNASDEQSFITTPITGPDDWQLLLETTFKNAGIFADLIETLPDDILFTTFQQEKYGNYYRNLQGIIEHLHYHLGQITLLKKLLPASDNK